MAELKQKPGQDIPIYGSGELVRTLTEHRLIDEYRLMVHPVIATPAGMERLDDAIRVEVAIG